MKKSLTALGLIASLTVTECMSTGVKVSDNYQTDITKSTGINILMVAGVDTSKFQDLKLKESYQEDRMTKSDAKQVVKDQMAGSVVSALGGVNNASVGSSFGAGMLHSMINASPIQRHYAMFFIPEDMATSEQEAKLVAANAILDCSKGYRGRNRLIRKDA